jgi:hypothetical protein
VALLEQSPPQ